MKHIYSTLQRRNSIFVIFLICILCNTVFAQQTIDEKKVEQGVLRIKVSEELASSLEHTLLTRNSDNIVLTGIGSIDRINRQYKVSGLKRVFRPAGKFEEKHRKHGLHLWYEIQMDKAAPVLQALSSYGSLEAVEKVEPVYKKTIIDHDNRGTKRSILSSTLLNDKSATVATLPGASNDPFLSAQWHYNNTGQTGGTPGADIRLIQAWGIETGKSDVIVAVTDGGIQVDHPDLAANMWVNTDEISGNNIDDDNNGYVDDINGYGFGDDTGFIAPNSHGTHVGGTVAATTNNGIGVAGVAGGSGVGDGARLMSCAAFGANDTGGFAETYVYAADNGAVISQNSWGYQFPDVFEQAVLDGIDYFIAEAGRDEFGNQVGPMNGGIVIFAAGNDDLDDEWYPGFYEPTLAVAATTHNDTKAYYSNFGTWVDISAPGGETINVAQQGIASTVTNGAYGFFQGTSMACPHVSGAAALIVSKYGGPGFTPTMLRARLVQTADNIDALNPDYAGLLGSGRLNAFAALQDNDNAPPEAIDDLAVSSVDMNSVTLTWTAPADSGNGSATLYDIRYSLSPITESNFEEATPVLSPPLPKPAGEAETVTIGGLIAGTSYYFAIKSADFFGNESAVSNVVNQTTDFPPVIAVSPPVISDTLQVGSTSNETLSISNNGQGPLHFTISTTAPWITLSDSFGTVDAGNTMDIQVTLSAHDLLWDTIYFAQIVISSNDPAADSLIMTVDLGVIPNGAPIASIEPSSLHFGDVFIGQSVQKNITVHNGGSEVLVLSASTTDADFTIDSSSDSVHVPSFDDVVITVSYSPSSAGVDAALLTISTNDPSNPEFSIPLTGEGAEPPQIEVVPDSLLASLHTGNTSTQQITITNNGGSDLEFSVSTSASGSVTTSQQVTLSPIEGTIQRAATYKKTASLASASPQQLTIKSVGTLATSIKVLILTPDENVNDLATILNSFGDIEATVFPLESLAGITLEDLTPYDLVMTTNNTQWLQAGNVNPAVIGDLLADYIDQGGKAIVNEFAYSYDDWRMGGRFINEQYGPFTPSTTDADIAVSLGTILAPGHPVMKGVNSLQYTGFVQNVGLAPGAVALTTWSNGDLCMAANKNVVALNLLPSLGNGDPIQWSGDLPTIYQNAIHWLVGPSFVKVNPGSGVVAPGTQLTLEVTFDASGLAGGFYTASLDISTNVPGNTLVSVPALLEVLGPEFTVTPDSLVEEIEKGETSTRTITLINNGSGEHSYEVDVNIVNQQKTLVPAVAIKKNQFVSQAKRALPAEKRTTAQKFPTNLNAIEALTKPAVKNTSRKQMAVALAATSLYATDFESFALGDITDQDGWFGQFGNWTIEELNPSSGIQHMQGLSDGLGESVAFSPSVTIGTEAKSTTTMNIDLSGSGVTWQIIPQSPAAQSVVTRIQFSPDGTAQALVSDGAGGTIFADIAAEVPVGYFDLTIESDRASSVFTVYFNGENVFTGQGFAGDIEEVVILSAMEVAGPTLDIDDFQILDGAKEFAPPFVSVSPVSGVLGAGESIELTVTFDASELKFGAYAADIVIDIAGVEQLNVPTLLNVVGDRAIEVDPTVVQAVVPYKEDTIRNIQIRNTGGRPLDYSMTVIGADIVARNSKDVKAKGFNKAETDLRIQQKAARDNKLSVQPSKEASVLQVLSGASMFEEHFEGSSFPPAGWNVVDNEGTGVAWNFAAFYGEGNYAGSGEAATASSDAAGEAEFDTELWTPLINTSGLKNITLQFNANYQNFANLDFLDLDIQIEGQTTWQNVLHWNEDHGTLFGTGVTVTVPLDEYLDNASSFRLRWHYYDPNTNDWDWYAQIDDVVILGDANTWLTVSPATGTVPVGSSADISARFDAEDLDAGFYVAGILVNSNAVKTPLVGVVASLEVLQPAEIHVSPDSLYQELMIGESATQTVTISNQGVSPLKFTIGEEMRDNTGVQTEARREPSQKRTSYSASTPLTDPAAFTSQSKVQQAGTALYSTTFEEFIPGDINGQQGWAGQFGNWTIESENPASGLLHFRGLSDGFGQSLAFSPEVTTGSEPISSTTMMIDATQAAGATWQIIPQSITEGLVNTRFEFGPEGTLQALVQDSLGGGFYQPIAATVPTGYFELRIDIERATSVFTIFFDGTPIFTGQGFAGDIEQVVVLSLMEINGPTFDIDNMAILDGEPKSPWVAANPSWGIVAAGSSVDVSVIFNADDLEEGVYTKVFTIESNDPLTPVIYLPVTLNAMDNDPPVLAPISEVSVIETGSEEVTFTATDEDDSVVNITVTGQPDFMTVTYAGNGTATYSITPALGDAGQYSILVTAEDARGEIDTAIFYLSVVPYGVENFSIVNVETGEVVLEFEDSVTVDVAYFDFVNHAIRANTNPKKVGSVQFRVNGKKVDLDNEGPYMLNRLVLPVLGKGNHVLRAESFTQSGSRGQRGRSAEVLISIINSAKVTGFEVVNTRGVPLMELQDGGVINVRQPGYNQITIVASTNGNKGVGSIRFELNGRYYHIDNFSPHSLTGDLFGYFIPWSVRPGHYTLKAIPYSLPLGLGIPGEPLTIDFEVIRENVSAFVKKKSSSTARTSSLEESIAVPETSSFRISPVPVKDKLKLYFTGDVEGDVELIIHNMQGQSVYRRTVSANELKDNYEINVSTLNIVGGVYYLRLVGSKRTETGKFLKE